MRILGIDPGIAIVGWGVIERSGPSYRPIAMGAITTPSSDEDGARLIYIAEQIKTLVRVHKPDRIGIEKLYFATNAKTAMAVGQARGVIILTLHECTVPIEEVTPLEVKSATTGYGKADKRQIQAMITRLLNLKTIPTPDDVADALAIAFTAATKLKRN